jgi:hypothetical protein
MSSVLCFNMFEQAGMFNFAIFYLVKNGKIR